MASLMIEVRNVENDILFKCSIAGYQFPSKDDDWLLLEVQLIQGVNRFSNIDAAINAHELVSAYEWFLCLSQNRLPRYAHLEFIEPCLSFQFLAAKDGKVRISIKLSHELKPDFPIYQFGRSSDRWNVIFDLGPMDFDAIIKGIRSSIEHFPIRIKS